MIVMMTLIMVMMIRMMMMTSMMMVAVVFIALLPRLKEKEEDGAQGGFFSFFPETTLPGVL